MPAPWPFCGSFATITKGPLKPGPKPSASRSYASRVVSPFGLVPASLTPRRSERTGMQRMIRRPPERIAASHGRFWISRLQAYHLVSSRIVFWPPREARDLPFVDPVADPGEQRREQGQRGDHREQHRQRRRHRDAVEEGDVQQEHPHQGDDHRRPGEEDGAPGGVDRVDRAFAWLHPLVEVVAEAGDDEERVVDPDPEPDHDRQERRERGGVEDVGAERHQAEADAEREQRGDDRQPHRDHRAEGEQQDDDRRQQADPLRGAFVFFLGFFDRLTAELHFEAFAVGPLGGLDDPFRCSCRRACCPRRRTGSSRRRSCRPWRSPPRRLCRTGRRLRSRAVRLRPP